MRISNAARNLDRDTQFFNGLPSPVRSNETLLEMIYEAHLKPGWLRRSCSWSFETVPGHAGGLRDLAKLRRAGMTAGHAASAFSTSLIQYEVPWTIASSLKL